MIKSVRGFVLSSEGEGAAEEERDDQAAVPE
jgi:hypothetical protein